GQLLASLNYYRLSLDDAIGWPSLQGTLDACYSSPGLSAEACEAIRRNASGRITSLEGQVTNIRRATTSGIDISANYRLPLQSLGLPAPLDLSVTWQGHRLLYWDEYTSGSKRRYGDTIAPYTSGSLATWRWNLMTALAGEHWSVLSTIRYVGSADVLYADPSVNPDLRVAAVTYWDLVASYGIRGVTWMLGVTNLLDREPPFVLDGSTNSSVSTYDYVGRYIFTRLSYQQ
ncbi:MAG TPA: hypothetical protein VFX59_28670, partial [Polyangiales bacterium]|nr:hypothetical protein [Polyangiales bacterium]